VPVVTTPVAGQGRLVVTPAAAVPGDVVRVHGAGFRPGAAVVLRWQPGAGQWAVTTRPDGTFDAHALVLPGDVPGRRALVAIGAPAAPAPFFVLQATGSAGGFDPAVFLRR
jgi:hypothetical protein